MEPMGKKPGRREFKRGILSYRGERWEVRITGPQGSGILTSMTLANCFVVIEEERGDVAAGDTVFVEPFALA
jgi:molybdopterin molybdotransferase